MLKIKSAEHRSIKRLNPDFRRINMLYYTIIMMFLIFSLLTTLNLTVFSYFKIAILDFIGVIVSAFLYYLLRFKSKVELCSWLVVLIIAALLSWFIYMSGGENYAILWIMVLPPISYFLLGVRYGTVICLASYSIFIAIIYYHISLTDTEEINLSALFNAIEVMLISLFVLRYYEKSRTEALRLLEIQNQELERLSTTDALTGLNNRKKIDDILSAELSKASQNQPLSIMLCDIDHFKHINDTYGHLYGDKVLINIANLFKGLLCNYLIGRWGGEEFLVVLPNTTQEKAIELTKGIQKKLNEQPIGSLKVTLSCGISTAFSNVSLDAILLEADEALYKAKNSGRNCIVTAQVNS